ncbi:Melanoma-associated antigen D2, partial [Haplosporangium sp. Z 27]
EDEDYGSRSGGSSKRSASNRNTLSNNQGSSSGSQKHVLRDDSDQDSDSYGTKAIRQTTSGTKAVDIPPEDFERLVKDVVRLAIFTSHSEQALKRDDIKNVLNDHSKLYDAVFLQAQTRLRDIFGMELVELTTKGRTGQAAEKGDVVDWEAELEDMGLLMVILSLILVRQGAIYESALMSHFRRLSLLEDNSPFGEIQKKLEVLIKKRYLDKFKLEHMDESGEKVEVEYRWGARSKIEVPEENIVKFIQEVFGSEAPMGLEARSRTDTFLESNCTSELWRLRLGQSTAWNLSSITWESVPLREDTTATPPVSGIGLKTLEIPGNNTLPYIDGTSVSTQSISPYMIEFGRAGCADTDERIEGTNAKVQPWIGFNIYNPVMNTWETIDLVNTTEDMGFNTTAAMAVGNWLSPTVAVDHINFAWYIILQSTAPLRQVILRKDLTTLTSFMSHLDLTKTSSTMFPIQLLYEGWEVASILNENAPFVSKGVATVVKNQIIIISGTANSFTPGDTDHAELRGCDHAYIFSTTKRIWTRQGLSVTDNGPLPDTREKAAFLAIGNKIYMHGGVKPFQTVLSDLWILDTDTWTWTRALDGPGPRADHTLLQYHEYILAISGFDAGRNVPITTVLPIMAYNTNSSNWTDFIRPTLNTETSFVTNLTRAAIIIGTVTVGAVLLVLGLSTHLLRKWNQRNYMKVNEDLELDEQRRKASKSLPSILKKSYLSESSGNHLNLKQKDRGHQTELIFEDMGADDRYESAYRDSSDNERGDEEGNENVQKVSLLSRSQLNPISRPPRRVRIEEHVNRVDEGGEAYDGDRDTDDETDDGQVIIRMPSDLSRREE